MKPVEEIARDLLNNVNIKTGDWDGWGHPPEIDIEDALSAVAAALRAERERAERAEDEVREFQLVFDAHWDASQRAIKAWQEAHPGNGLTWPDAKELLVWLMERAEKAEAERDEARKLYEAADKQLGLHLNGTVHETLQDLVREADARAATARNRALEEAAEKLFGYGITTRARRALQDAILSLRTKEPK